MTVYVERLEKWTQDGKVLQSRMWASDPHELFDAMDMVGVPLDYVNAGKDGRPDFVKLSRQRKKRILDWGAVLVDRYPGKKEKVT